MFLPPSQLVRWCFISCFFSPTNTLIYDQSIYRHRLRLWWTTTHRKPTQLTGENDSCELWFVGPWPVLREDCGMNENNAYQQFIKNNLWRKLSFKVGINFWNSKLGVSFDYLKVVSGVNVSCIKSNLYYYDLSWWKIAVCRYKKHEFAIFLNIE